MLKIHPAVLEPLPVYPYHARVYYHDTDAGGVVYHGRYLEFLEQGRTEFLRHMGYTNTQLQKDHGILLTVREYTVKHLKSAHLDDLLCIDTHIQAVRPASVWLTQHIRLAHAPDTVTVHGGRLRSGDLGEELEGIELLLPA
jgi:tol-pal system-associated acyl-CoA thioesterase